ncbi:nucleotidyl transferase AbiEii/AbiGii toxin family protein [Flexithrix dorotheae]|uniref:nucleotidyl transferase AbiEii/AbiGii toxin family protein n=1 Tax=Flexithrix dorotheae TaxID=70993 RepID=UPI00035FBD2A|nr:nucleotidyl transferase AbiEii/AbiGii toxin family protein [Flexithrix dorotheae]
MEYLNLFRKLFENRIRYLVCGGLAVNIYGIPRMTADIDLLLDFNQVNITNFNKSVKELAYQPHAPISLEMLLDEEKRMDVVKNKNMIAYSFYNTLSDYMNLDVLIDAPFDFDHLWNNRETRKIEEVEVYIVALEDLIAMKKYANRNQDKQDIIMLSKLKNIKPE